MIKHKFHFDNFQVLEGSISSKDTEMGQLKQRVGDFEQSIASKDTEISQLKQQYGELESSIASKDTKISQLEQRLNVSNHNTVIIGILRIFLSV